VTGTPHRRARQSFATDDAAASRPSRREANDGRAAANGHALEPTTTRLEARMLVHLVALVAGSLMYDGSYAWLPGHSG
jgi:hypothetical protein